MSILQGTHSSYPSDSHKSDPKEVCGQQQIEDHSKEKKTKIKLISELKNQLKIERELKNEKEQFLNHFKKQLKSRGLL